MPGIAARLGHDVHDRTGVASVFRTELVGHQNVLRNKLGIRDEESGAADAVVIVVLAVDLLVIVATAQAVRAEADAAVLVRERIVTNRADARNKQRQVVQTFVFLQTGERGKRGSREGVGDLGLRGFNQWGVG